MWVLDRNQEMYKIELKLLSISIRLTDEQLKFETSAGTVTLQSFELTHKRDLRSFEISNV